MFYICVRVCVWGGMYIYVYVCACVTVYECRTAGVQGRLDGVAEEAERGAAEGVALPCPALLLGPGTEL